MASSNKPLSYDSLKVVIEHLEANCRYILASRCPLIRILHRKIPIRIEYLRLDENEFRVNNFDHLFYCTTLQPDSAFSQFDLTPYGAADTSTELKERDVAMGKLYPREEEMNIRRLQDKMISREILGRSADPSRDPFETVILYKLNRGTKPVYLPIGFKIRDAIRLHLKNFLMGDHPPFIKHLEIATSYAIIRIPNGLKNLKFNELKVCANEALNNISSILSPLSFPIKKLFTVGPDLILENPILHKAKKLILDIENDSRWAERIIDLPNKDVYISSGDISTEQLIQIAQDWVDIPRDLGFKFAIKSNAAVEALDQIGEAIRALRAVCQSRICYQFSHSYTLQIGATRELNIYGYMSPNQEEELEMEDGTPWMLVMEVMQLGSARYLPKRKSPPKNEFDIDINF